MSDMNIQQVLNQMRVLAQNGRLPEAAEATGKPEFSKLLAESLKQVNEIQQEAGNLKTAYSTGDPRVDLPEVMVAVQKASVSFEAATQVRNKLLSAYQEVMSMQV